MEDLPVEDEMKDFIADIDFDDDFDVSDVNDAKVCTVLLHVLLISMCVFAHTYLVAMENASFVFYIHLYQ